MLQPGRQGKGPGKAPGKVGSRVHMQDKLTFCLSGCRTPCLLLSVVVTWGLLCFHVPFPHLNFSTRRKTGLHAETQGAKLVTTVPGPASPHDTAPNHHEFGLKLTASSPPVRPVSAHIPVWGGGPGPTSPGVSLQTQPSCIPPVWVRGASETGNSLPKGGRSHPKQEGAEETRAGPGCSREGLAGD